MAERNGQDGIHPKEKMKPAVGTKGAIRVDGELVRCKVSSTHHVGEDEVIVYCETLPDCPNRIVNVSRFIAIDW